MQGSFRTFLYGVEYREVRGVLANHFDFADGLGSYPAVSSFPLWPQYVGNV